MSSRTPTQIRNFLGETQYRFDCPQQYYGDEPNAYLKDWDAAEVRYCIFASWPYEQAAGNQSIPLVYKTINDWAEWTLCDRSYLPSTPRDMRLLTSAGIPTFGIESKHELLDFDIIGTSLSYPVLNINLIKQLKNSGIPARWKERQKNPERWPFVLIGGTAYGAPEAMSAVCDAHFAGEVEDEVLRDGTPNPGIGAVLDRIRAFKASGLWSTDREECYKELAREFNFLYFPRFIDVHYDYLPPKNINTYPKETPMLHPQKQVVGYTSNIDGMKLPILKRVVKDMDKVEGLTNPPLLFLDPGMGSGDVEVARGCPAWCSFCALTYRQKPYRQRTVPEIVRFSAELSKNTGGIHIAPFSPDFPMFPQKKRLISELLQNVTDEVDASSMRVDDFIADSQYILLQAHAGMDQVTLGVEGNSQRMRDLVGKGCADEDIKEAVARGLRAGIRRFKLYMICDLPGEDAGDIRKILNLAKELADIRDSMGRSNVKIQFSWTPLLIEAGTPFQWFAPTDPNRALAEVWDDFKSIKIDFKLGSKAEPNKHIYFQVCQRGSREVGEALADTIEELDVGCWGGVPKTTAALLEQKLKERGFLNGYADIFDQRDKHEMFGWEFMDLGINVELLWVTYQQMKEFLENTNSSDYDTHFGDLYHGNEWIERCDTKCYGKTCGTCDAEDLAIRREYIQGAAEEINIDLNNVKVIDQKSVKMKLRMKVWKDDAHRFVGNDHWRYAVRRAAYRAGVNIAKRTVRIGSDKIKFKDWISGTDFVEFGLTQKISNKDIPQIMEKMNAELTGCKIVKMLPHPAQADEMRSEVDLGLYQMELDVDKHTTLQKIREFKEADYVKMIVHEDVRMAGVVREEINAKEFVSDLWLVKDGHRLFLRALIRGKVSPYQLYASLLGRASWLEAAKYPAVRLDAFIETDNSQYDFLRPECGECGYTIPVNLLDEPYDAMYCPPCKDKMDGTLVGELANV